MVLHSRNCGILSTGLAVSSRRNDGIKQAGILKRLDRKHKVFHFGDFDTSIVDIADNTVDVEKIIETKMLIEDLYRALDSLNNEERKLIEALYFDDKTLTEVAKQRDTNPMKISRLRNKILEKLRKLLDK